MANENENESITVEFRGIADLVGDILVTLAEGLWTADRVENGLCGDWYADGFEGRKVQGHIVLVWEDERHTVTRDTVIRGLTTAFDPKVRLNSGLRERIQYAVSTDGPQGCGCLDIEEADVVAQLGLFGEIVYG